MKIVSLQSETEKQKQKFIKHKNLNEHDYKRRT